MQIITIISQKDRHYNAFIGSKPFGTLKYPKWYSQNANIIIGSAVYKIRNKGFFYRCGEISNGGKILFNVRSRHRGTQVSRIEGFNHFYTLKAKGLGYMLENDSGREIMEIKQEFSLDKTTPDYVVKVNTLDNDDLFLLVLITVYYFHAAMTDATASALAAS